MSSQDKTWPLQDTLVRLQGVRCIIPSCTLPWCDMAHLEPSGHGGQPSTREADNLVGLCRQHHDEFDGRSMQGRQRLLLTLLRYVSEDVRRGRALLHIGEESG